MAYMHNTLVVGIVIDVTVVVTIVIVVVAVTVGIEYFLSSAKTALLSQTVSIVDARRVVLIIGPSCLLCRSCSYFTNALEISSTMRSNGSSKHGLCKI